jgi:hypothetical protein
MKSALRGGSTLSLSPGRFLIFASARARVNPRFMLRLEELVTLKKLEIESMFRKNDDRETIVERAIYRQNQYHLQPDRAVYRQNQYHLQPERTEHLAHFSTSGIRFTASHPVLSKMHFLIEFLSFGI